MDDCVCDGCIVVGYVELADHDGRRRLIDDSGCLFGCYSLGGIGRGCRNDEYAG